MRFHSQARSHRQTQHSEAESPPSTFKLQGRQGEGDPEAKRSGAELFASSLFALRGGCLLRLTLYIIDVSLKVTKKGQIPAEDYVMYLCTLAVEGTWSPCLDWDRFPP